MPKEQKDSGNSSVHLLNWPKPYVLAKEDLLIEELFKPIINLIPEAAKSLEEMRNLGEIGSSFDAQINILTKTQDRYTFLQSFKQELCEIFKVSQVWITFEANQQNDFSVKITKAQGSKCLRCWNYSLDVGKNKEHPLICNNCLIAIGEKK